MVDLKKEGKYILIACLILFSFILPLVEAKTFEEWYAEGADLSESGKYNEAIKAFDEALKINPPFNLSDWLGVTWTSKGMALYKLKRYEEAIKAYDEALKIDHSLLMR